MRTTRTSGGPGPDRPERSEGPQHEQNSFAQAERFARAVEGVLPESGLPTAFDDELHRELAVVAALRHGGAAIGPDRHERDRMRQRIMAEFPSVVHDGSSPVLTLGKSGVGGGSGVPGVAGGSGIAGGSRSGRFRSSAARRRRHHRVAPDAQGRFMIAAAAALCLLMSLSGMSLLLSREALPGDPLYTFKRSAESAELGLTFGDESKARKHLEFASARVNEIEMMAQHADADGSWSEGEDRFLHALDDFDQNISAGIRLLTAVAADGGSDLPPFLHGWIEQHHTRLEAVRGALPLGASTRLGSTLELLDRVTERVSALDRRADCIVVTSGVHDDLGLLPARGACESTLPDNEGGPTAAPPLLEVDNAAEADLTGSLVPPGLLASPSGVPIAEPVNPGELGFPTTDSDGFLPTAPGQPGVEPPHPALPDPSVPPILPLPLSGIPLLPLSPLEDPHHE